jgi:hypothetical protein
MANYLNQDFARPPRLTLAQAEEILTAAASGADCTVLDANTFAGQLLSFYPQAQRQHVGEGFVAGVTALLSTRPAWAVRRALDPARGLPSRQKFVPAIAEIAEAIDSEVNRHRRIIANAKWAKQEAEKRAAQVAEDAEMDRRRGSPERRKQIGDAAVALLRQTVLAMEGGSP